MELPGPCELHNPIEFMGFPFVMKSTPASTCTQLAVASCFLTCTWRHLRGMVIIALLCLTFTATADGPDGEGGDVGKAPSALVEGTDIDLQSGLEEVVDDLGLWSHVESRKLAISLVDISDIDKPRFASLNPDHMMYAASLPKIAILLGAFVEAARGDLVLDDALRQEMVNMIRFSSNTSATHVLEEVGRKDLIDILRSDRLRLYDPDLNGGLWVGKDYAKKNAYQRDPLHNLSHGATVHQVARFFYLLEKGDLVDEEFHDDMKEMLSSPGISHKFVKGLKARPQAQVYRKSGTWRDYHADAALVESGGRRFIMVGLAQHPDGGEWLTRLAVPLHDLAVGREAGPPVVTGR